ncbi:MAG: GDSL-type esterase/lipase family protein [Pirellulales bacterium]
MRFSLRAASRLMFGLLCVASSFAVAGETPLKPGSRVAVIGDSITEQKLYSKFIEAYLLASSGVPDVKVFQYGWGGETASGFAARATNDLAGFQPTIATLCYGMNDGGYQPYRDEIGKNYENNMRNVLKKLDEAGVKSVVIGSPGAVDTFFFRPGQKLGDQPAHVAYNDNLAHLRDIDRKLAEETKSGFADVHKAMADAMGPAQGGRQTIRRLRPRRVSSGTERASVDGLRVSERVGSRRRDRHGDDRRVGQGDRDAGSPRGGRREIERQVGKHALAVLLRRGRKIVRRHAQHPAVHAVQQGFEPLRAEGREPVRPARKKSPGEANRTSTRPSN